MEEKTDYDGYQVIEPDKLQPLSDIDLDLNIRLLNWIIFMLNRDLGSQLAGASLHVINVTYISKYPAIGVKYLSDIPDVGEMIENKINEWIGGSLLYDLLHYIRTEPLASQRLISDE